MAAVEDDADCICIVFRGSASQGLVYRLELDLLGDESVRRMMMSHLRACLGPEEQPVELRVSLLKASYRDTLKTDLTYHPTKCRIQRLDAPRMPHVRGHQGSDMVSRNFVIFMEPAGDVLPSAGELTGRPSG